MKETKLHHQRKFPALGLAISKILCNLASLKLFIETKMTKAKASIRRLYIGIVPPYRCYNGAMHHLSKMVLAMGKAMPFLFAKVKSQPFNGFIV